MVNHQLHGITACASCCLRVLLLSDHVPEPASYSGSNLSSGEQLSLTPAEQPFFASTVLVLFGHPEVYIASVPGLGIVSHF